MTSTDHYLEAERLLEHAAARAAENVASHDLRNCSSGSASPSTWRSRTPRSPRPPSPACPRNWTGPIGGNGAGVAGHADRRLARAAPGQGCY
jgi:hypothetical protein